MLNPDADFDFSLAVSVSFFKSKTVFASKILSSGLFKHQNCTKQLPLN